MVQGKKDNGGGEEGVKRWAGGYKENRRSAGGQVGGWEGLGSST